MSSKFLIIFILGSLVIAAHLTQCDNAPQTNIHPLTKSWEIAVPNQEIPQGLTSLSAKQCGVCHQKHYEEWSMSTHAHAWTDLQFQAELKKESSPFMCINCHIPLQNQQEYIIKGLVDGDIYQPVKEKNPYFDPELQLEGINCASCHVRNNTIIGPTGAQNTPHKTIKDPDFLSETLCISCHNATAVITPTLACTFETGDEWKAGPYFGKKNCISCHMEVVEREIVHGFGKRISHLHYFAGSGIPKFDTVETKGLNGLGIYANLARRTYNIGDSIVSTLKVKNEFAGHKVPTGDPERFFLISFELKNDSGRVLESKTERIGEQWEWYPEAKKLDDNNLLPGEERVFTFTYETKKKGDIELNINIKKYRLNQEAAEYNKLNEHYPLFITIYDEDFNIEVR